MQEQLRRGKEWEKKIDEFFQDRWEITPLSREHEKKKLGDRFYKDKYNNTIYFIEYKTDERAAQTGNIFIETISVDTHHKKGWALTCLADRIFIYIPDNKIIYILRPEDIRNKLLDWHKVYPVKPCSPWLNDGYVSYGVLIPIAEIEKLCIYIKKL